MTTDNTNRIIDAAGDYGIKANAYLIEVRDNTGILQYRVITRDGKELLRSKERASIYQRWYIFWDREDRLWVHSSDIGTSVWINDSKDVYQQRSVVDDVMLVKEMPAEVFDQLPASVKRRWSNVRKQ